MHIATIEVLRVAIPFDDHLAATGTARTLATKAMETLLVKVTSDTGLIGWGEAFGHRINAATCAALAESVGPFFIGAPLDLGDAPVASARIDEAHRAFHLFGRTGPALYAISAIDTALWDLKARHRGEPLYRLLGGTRDRVQAYASLVTYNGAIEPVVRNSMQAYDAGFRHIKLHEKDVSAITAVRAALPDDAELMVDVNCIWSLEQARLHVDQLRGLKLAWLEEPIWPPDDFESLAALRHSGVTLAAGENASGIDGLERYLKAGAPHIVQPSVTKLGGVTAMLQAYRLGRQYGVRVQPHCFYYGAGLLATAHVIAALDDTALLEVPWVDFEARLTPETAFPSTVRLGDQPGLGYAPDADILARFLKTSALVQ